MPRFAQQHGPARAAPLPVLVLLVGMLSAVGLAACGSSPTQAPSASVPPSAPASATLAPASASPAPSRSPAPSGGGSGSYDACALLSATDLSKIVGGEVHAKPMPSAGWAAGQCAWNSATSGFVVSVGTAASIQKAGDPAAPDAKAMLTAFERRMRALGTPKNVAGIGDGAVLGKTGMAAYLGGAYLEAMKLSLTDDQLIEIMKLAVAKL